MKTVEVQKMKSIMQTMAEAVQVMKSKIMGNASGGLAVTGSFVGETPKEHSQRGSLTELGIVRVQSCVP